VAMAFGLYFTTGRALSDFNKKCRKVLNLASAGSTEKAFKEAIVRVKGKYFECDNEKIDENQYTLLVVDGNSMSSFGIKNGEIVFIKDNKNISHGESPVFALRIPDNVDKIEYKLRKAVDFYDCGVNGNQETFVAWIKNHPELNEDELQRRYSEENETIADCKRLGCRVLVSKTTKNGEPYYSFHPENRIVGKVKYVVPKENVKIIEKR
jgi:hypothetical protein